MLTVRGVTLQTQTDRGIIVVYPSASGMSIVIPNWDRITVVSTLRQMETDTTVMIGIATSPTLTATIAITTLSTMEWGITVTAGTPILAVTTVPGATRRTGSKDGLTVMSRNVSLVPQTTL